jgi:dephospho-CoA kinase
MIIGITGKSGSGKTTLAILTTIGRAGRIKHVNVDEIAHDAMKLEHVKIEIENKFGASAAQDGKKLGDLVFANRDKYEQLSDLVWGEMEKMIDRELDADCDVYVIEWILLPMTKYFDSCDVKILVKRDGAQRIEAVLKRDGLSFEYLAKREMHSIEYDESAFDFVIKNNGNNGWLNCVEK